MSWNRMSLLKKIAGTIMAITVVSTVSLSFMQDRLYNNNFETIFRSLEDSVMTIKRDSARHPPRSENRHRRLAGLTANTTSS